MFISNVYQKGWTTFMSNKRLLNDGWCFTKQALGQTLETIHQSNLAWQSIDLPHDWLIYNVNDLYETSEGWYKRILSSSDLDPCVNYALRFEGVYMDSTLFVNGHKLFNKRGE